MTPYRKSVTVPDNCYHLNTTKWDNATYCDQTITLRNILFTNAIPEINFNAIDIKARLLVDPMENFTETKPAET